MPIVLPLPRRRLSQLEFGELAFEVMRHVFAIHLGFTRRSKGEAKKSGAEK
jgi:hypothetical protein